MIHPDPKMRPDLEKLLYQFQKLNRFKKLNKEGTASRFDFMDDVQQNIIKNSEYRQFFKDHLRKEMSIEALLFFEDVQLFSELKSSQSRFMKADEICLSYLEETSALEINVSGKLKRNLAQEIQKSKLLGEISINIFDEMALSVSQMILVDTFSRFQNSQIGLELRNYIKNNHKEE
jgi:hypothetical protein